jgi:hypothetical protein
MQVLKAPFPYFGGKGRVAEEIWKRFGNVPSYVDPFFGSGAVLLARPHAPKTESVNDADALLCNFFRALQHDPEEVARYADHPVNEVDLHSRHLWLLDRKPDVEALLSDPDAYDAKAAGRWVWGLSLWIGSGWCSGKGPWRIVDGTMTKVGHDGGIERARPQLTHPQGIERKLPYVSHGSRGVVSAVLSADGALLDYLTALSDRLRRVRVCCGDWTRVVTPAVTTANGLTAVLLDPPYAGDERDPELYAHDSGTVAADVRAWAIAHGGDPLLRIAYCGYAKEGETMPEGWTALHWKAAGGYGGQGDGRGRANAARECVWFSRHCLKPRERPSLFDSLEETA